MKSSSFPLPRHIAFIRDAQALAEDRVEAIGPTSNGGQRDLIRRIANTLKRRGRAENLRARKERARAILAAAARSYAKRLKNAP